ncbi:PREDICTED: uncharacterized protein LOC106806883 [Priapulus caudatus]|uniref:Uncharacterized protein LOC106806883 n=1 Tax=Priapulus caudatus TaxID=37621 RepID=A0ABM1DX36_PRICU|nr:PREDICTED: uncharacterized protein LOC106806883 [Priapulus caudatus]
MAKLFKVVDHNEPGTSGTKCLTTDWNKCVLCQEGRDEMLKCPSNSARATGCAGYKNIAEHLVAFDKISCLPPTLKLSQLDEGQGIEAAFRHHKAKWHDSCRLQYNKTKLQRGEKRKMPHEDDPDTHKFTRQSNEHEHCSTDICFFCGKPAAEDALRNASTFELDIRVRQCALKLQDKPLLAKLSAGDLIAQEAKYHAQCLASLYNKTRETKSQESNVDDVNHGIAFAGLVTYIEEVRMDNLVAPVFKLTDLVNLYSTRLAQLGTHVTGRVHSTQLKNRILSYFPDMDAHKQGRDVILVCNGDIGAALGKACGRDADNEAVLLASAANIVRRDMFKMKQDFRGSFDAHCQEELVPVSLLALVSMVLYGPNITTQSSSVFTPQPALTLSQLLMYNSLVCQREIATTNRPTTWHSQDRETPLPIYLGIMIHTKTRKRALVDTLFDLGLCISYDRVLDISTELGNKICQYYEVEKAVCPPQLKGGLFTTAAVDNIDHNPSSTSAYDSFHGTGISLFQHPDDAFTGVQRNVATNPDNTQRSPKRKPAQLPDTYTNVPPVSMLRQDPPVPKVEGPNKADCLLIPEARLQKEYRWLEQMKTVLATDTLQKDETQVFSPYILSQLQHVSRVDVVWDEYLPESLKTEKREQEREENAAREGYTKVSIRTVDTDVLVLAVTAAQRLNITELWDAFGAGKSFRHLAAHEMARALGPERCIALPMFHSFTGCDTVSSFGGRGKKTAWDTWTTFDDVTRAFCVLAATPEAIEDWMGPLERFVVTGGGRGRTQVDGKFTGPHYQKRPRPVADSSAVDAKRGAEEGANVSRQHFSALPFASVVDSVLRSNIAIH